MIVTAYIVGLLTGSGVAEPPGKLVVAVDLSRRQLEVRVDGRLTARYPVAIGKAGHRTPTGTYSVSKVIWNPAWVPPDAEWAKDKEPKAPGETGNPMGRVKIMFGPALFVHGTTATGTLGEPASHGCVRLSNLNARRLARLVMEYGGAPRPAAWYAKVQANTREAVEVDISESARPPNHRVAWGGRRRRSSRSSRGGGQQNDVSGGVHHVSNVGPLVSRCPGATALTVQGDRQSSSADSDPHVAAPDVGQLGLVPQPA